MSGLVSPVAVCVLPEAGANAARTVSYPKYVHEILQHAGLCYSDVARDKLVEALPHTQVLVTVGHTVLPDDTTQDLTEWVRRGGAWISIAGVNGLAELFGVELPGPSFAGFGGAGFSSSGEGFLQPVEETYGRTLLDFVEIPLHYFGGIAVTATTGRVLAEALDPHHRPTGRVAVVEQHNGDGVCLLLAPDLVGSVVRIQQGVAITRDGVPSPDGTGPINDGVLKSDDGAVLDWYLDRQPVPGVPGFNAYLQPVADQWRDLLLRAIFAMAVRQKVRLPLLWYYPRNLSGLGHLSHDTDGNVVSDAEILLDTLAKADVPGTWLVIAPGYPKAIIDRICAAGHELGFHYDAMSEGTVWSETDFDTQWHAIVDLFGGKHPVSNKNHYLRWEGDTEFYHWCEGHDIALDQSKGASKTGEAGYGFGTCHVFFPIDPAGRPLNVLEMTTPTQDLIVFAPTAMADPILDAAAKYHGIAHFLFHPAHQSKDGVPKALLDVVAKGRALGFEWWTACRINTWERARRKMVWSTYESHGAFARVCVHAGETLPDATLLWLVPEGKGEVVRWGCAFHAETMTLEGGKDYELTFGA